MWLSGSSWPCGGGVGVLRADRWGGREERERRAEGGGGLFLSSGPRIRQQRAVPVRWQHPAYSHPPLHTHTHTHTHHITISIRPGRTPRIFQRDRSSPLGFSASLILSGDNPPRLPVPSVSPPQRPRGEFFSVFPGVVVWWWRSARLCDGGRLHLASLSPAICADIYPHRDE